MTKHYPSLKALLEVAKKSQTDLAEALGVSNSLISKIVRGESKPHRSLLPDLAKALLGNVNIGDLEAEDYMAKCLGMETDDEILAKH